MRWFFDHGIASRTACLPSAASAAFDQNRTVWLRSYAVSYLGAHGNQSDHEKIEQRYANVESEIERAHFAAALSEVEVGKRNAFYAKIKADGELAKRAIGLVKGGPVATVAAACSWPQLLLV